MPRALTGGRRNAAATRRLGVLGWPVAHSRSPEMHGAALAAMGLEGWRYQRLPVPPELFAETVRALPGAGFVGANVTIPHKQAALALADEPTARARAIGAANTLTFAAHGAIAAENTDAPALIGAVRALVAPQPLAGMSALVLGAGGSARAAVWALLQEGLREVSVWARRYERARALAGELGAHAVRAPSRADLLVNCTPVGLGTGEAGPGGAGQLDGPREGEAGGRLEQLSRHAEALNQLGLALDALHEYSNVVDLVYRTGGTPLLACARALGLGALDGAEILARQGALSLRIWTGREPPLEIMRNAARA